MKRVAALYLPDWSIDRLRRAGRIAAPPPEPVAADPAPLGEIAHRERATQCSVPNTPGWRPGARWARAEMAAQIERLPAHQRPPLRELGRRSEAADHPFKSMPCDEARGHSPVSLRSPATPEFSSRRQVKARQSPVLPIAHATTHRAGSRIVIAAACPVARALGIVPGMAVTQARAQSPELRLYPADPAGDRADLNRLALLLARRWSPVVAIEDGDLLFVEVTGVAHLFGGEGAMARRLVRLLARLGISARVAIADTPGAAWALARWGCDPVTLCPPGGQADALAPLPPAALRIAPDQVELLRRLGVDRIAALIALPRAPLVRRFGRALSDRIDQATGRLPEPLVPVIARDAIAVAQRFAEPILTAEVIAHWLGVLVTRLVAALTAAGEGARAVELIADRVDHVPQRIRIGLAQASRDPAHLLRLLARRIETIEPGYGIDAMTLHLRRSEPLAPQPVAAGLEHDATPDLAPLIDAIANRIGMARLWRAEPVESDVPERAVGRVGPLTPPPESGERLRPDDVRRLDRTGKSPIWHPAWPRPVRLLRRPEMLDHVLAELPDRPPLRFTWRGRTHRVVRADGPERIHGEWWRRSAERHATRDYFRVEDDAGQRFWLFRRGDGERPATGDLSWYLHGLFG
ncbi:MULTISPECIES: DUF6504 family protein [unclassified Sphingomonas]|uniref:DUF6504 family protein n=1 Tax=unclassified Sphingomonas TaxID=196159 RepID=UPI0008325D74|nr:MULTISPECIES: DUF6504 family protein [unclassified Sphingomonas]